MEVTAAMPVNGAAAVVVAILLVEAISVLGLRQAAMAVPAETAIASRLAAVAAVLLSFNIMSLSKEDLL